MKKGFRKTWIFGLAVALIFAFTPMSFAARGLTSRDQTIRGAKTFEHDVVFKKNVTVEGSLLEATQYSNEFWVDVSSGHDSVGNYGTTRLKPFKTIAYALDQCTANNGDIIYVMPGHTKAITADSGIDIDVAGVTVIGLGNGEDRPIFTFTTAATADFKIAAANVSIFNLVFKTNITEHDMQIEVTGDDAEIGFCEFREGTSTFEFGIQVGLGSADNDADRCYIHDCIFYEPTADDGDAAINIVKDMAGVRIENCDIYGDFDLAGIDVPAAGNAQVNLVIENCVVTNLLTGQHAIQIEGTGSTGKIVDCMLETDAIGTSIDAGGLEPYNVLWSDGTDQQSAALALTPVAGASVLTTADLTAIEAEVEDGLQAKELDHLSSLTDGAGQKYPLTAVEDSIICKILGDDDPAVCTSYDNSKHSLEAIGDLVADTNQESRHVAANVTDVLDHFAKTIDGGSHAYPDSPVNESIVAYILSKSAEANVSSYDNQTDSLEMSSDKHGAFTGDGGADQDDSAKASLDLAHTDLDTALRMGGLAYLAVVDSSADTTHFVDAELIGHGTDFFVTGWTMIVTWDAGGVSGAPEGEVVDITGYVTASGTFTHGATTQLGTGDRIMIIRDELASLFQKSLPTTAVAGSLQRYIAGGDTALGTDLGASMSLVDCIGTDGVDVADTVTGLAGMIGVNDADNAMDTSTVVVNDDGSVYERLEGLYYWQERTISVSADEVTANLFDVDGGPILIKSITGIVDVLIGANATTCKLVIDRDDLTADTEFTTAVNIETDVAGTVYVFTSANAAVLTPLTPGAVGSSNLMSSWFCPEGMVEQTMSADPGGAVSDHITWYMTYIPLKAGVTVTAQ